MSYFEENWNGENSLLLNPSNFYTCYGIVSSLINFGGQVFIFLIKFLIFQTQFDLNNFKTINEFYSALIKFATKLDEISCQHKIGLIETLLSKKILVKIYVFLAYISGFKKERTT
jgi:hypothetical protein